MAGDDWSFAEFKEHFYRFTGLNLHSYKERQIERRIRQFIERGKHGGFAAFYTVLKENPELMHKFMNYLTINTSGFFRDQGVFNYLQNTVLPDLLAGQGRLSIWSMGCSTGEEPYTLALIADELKALERVKILAGDIDEKALCYAVDGCYNLKQLEKLPPRFLASSFEKRDGCYRIKEKYKKAITFKPQNFLEPIYRNIGLMHLVVCRNVFIYFKTEIQEWIVEQIANIIAPGGYFVTGCSEFVNDCKRFGLERRIHRMLRIC